MIECFVQDPDVGALFGVNGIDDPVRWDGFSDSFGPVGMIPPANAVTLTGVGAGPIVGTYFSFLRFVDEYDNYSDLSPISAQFNASGTTGTITNATNATPIVITSAGHSLITGTVVKITGVGGNTNANSTFSITVVDANDFSLDGSNGTADYNGGGTWTSGIASISYTNVQTPTETKVVRRQILRNTDGQATTFYVDVDTTDLTGSTFSSSLTDALLQSNLSVPLLDSNGLPFANSNGKPLNYFKAMAQQLDRMFMAGLLEYNIGSCSVAFGSPTVQGAGTDWRTTMVGRFLYVDGASQTYQIASVNPTTQVITLTDNYQDTSNLFAFYSIKPPPAYRRIVQFTPPGSPQSWPIFNGVSIQETGDELTGLLQMGSFMFILERRHVHKLTFSQGPLIDGGLYLVAERGCVNQRCFVTLEQAAYMLDELGVHKFDLSSRSEPISQQIGTLFYPDKADIDANINWQWKENFHSMIDMQRETMRWFVCLDGNRYPRHALAYQHRLQRWWIEEYPFPIGGACAGYIGGFNGTPQVYYGGQHGKVFAAWSGTLDGARGSSGSTVQGQSAGATAYSLTDTGATFASGLSNVAIAIAQGTGKGQVRRIIDVNGQTVSIDRPWNVLPDTTSQYQIGGVNWRFRAGWIRLSPSETMMQRRFEMLFEPLTNPVTANLRFFTDYASNPDIQQRSETSAAGGGIQSIKDTSDLIIDLTKNTGLVRRDQPSGKDLGIQGQCYRQFELDGCSNLDQIKLYQFLWAGYEPPGGQ